MTLLGFAIAVGVHEALLDGILGYGKNGGPGGEITLGELHHPLAARTGRYIIGRLWHKDLFTDGEQTLDKGLVGGIHQGPVGKPALLHGALLGQNMTLVGVLALDFAGSGKGEPLFGTGIGFHFGHNAGFKAPVIGNSLLKGSAKIIKNKVFRPSSWPQFYFLVPLGAKEMNILFPSSLGRLSTLPTSSSCWAKVSKSSSPLSLNTMARPLKCT